MISYKEDERIVTLKHLSKLTTLKHSENIAIDTGCYERKIIRQLLSNLETKKRKCYLFIPPENVEKYT